MFKEQNKIDFGGIEDPDKYEEAGGVVINKKTNHKWIALDYGDYKYYGTTGANTVETAIDTGANLNVIRLEFPIIKICKSNYSIYVERGTTIERVGRDKTKGYKHLVAANFPLGSIRMIEVGDILDETFKDMLKSKGVMVKETKLDV